MNTLLLVDLQATWFFDGWSPVIRTLCIGICVYFALIIMLRISGKRTLSKMNAFDFVVTVSFGSTIATILLNNSISLLHGITALTVLIGLQYLVSQLTRHSDLFQELIKANPTILFYKGKYLEEEMKKHRVSEYELQAQVRKHGYDLMEQIDAIILETEGSFSVIEKLHEKPSTAMGHVKNYTDFEESKV